MLKRLAERTIPAQQRAWRTRVAAFAAALLLATAARGAEIAISCGAVGIEFELCRNGAEAWAREAGHSVRLVPTPNATNARRWAFTCRKACFYDRSP